MNCYAAQSSLRTGKAFLASAPTKSLGSTAWLLMKRHTRFTRWITRVEGAKPRAIPVKGEPAAPEQGFHAQAEHFPAGAAPGGKQGDHPLLELLLRHGLLSVLRQDLHLPQVRGLSSPSFFAPLKLGNRQPQ